MKQFRKLLGVLLAVLLLCSLLPWQTMAAAEEPEATPPGGVGSARSRGDAGGRL